MDNPDKSPEIRELDRPSAVLRRLGEFWHLDRKKLSELLGATFSEWSNDNAPRLGAALAYYSVFSIAPLLIVVIAVAGLVFGRQAAEGQIVWQIQDVVGRDGAQAIEKMIQSASAPKKGIPATAAGIITLIFGASLVVSELRNSLNLIWKTAQKEGDAGLLKGLVRMLHDRFLSFAMVLGIGFLLIVSLVINAVLAAVGKQFQGLLPLPEYALEGISFVISFIVTAILFAIIYRMLPDAAIAWSDVAIGAIVASALFTLGKLLIALYLGKSSLTSTYGAAGSLVLILVWVYYSAQIFFFGAEFTKVYANRHGSRLRLRLVTV